MFLKKVITSTVALSMLAVSVLNTTTAVSADAVSDTQNAINTNKSETDKLLKISPQQTLITLNYKNKFLITLKRSKKLKD